MHVGIAGTADFHGPVESRALLRAGFRFGRRGTQSSRNIMLGELADLFETLPLAATREDYARAVVAADFGVSTYVVQHQLQNHRIAQVESNGLHPDTVIRRDTART